MIQKDKHANSLGRNSSEIITRDSKQSVSENKIKIRIPTESKVQPSYDPSKAYNLIGVLSPEYVAWLKNEIDIPYIPDTPLSEIYPILSDILGGHDYLTNPATFWFLDIIGEVLYKAQKENSLDVSGQRQLIAWFGHVMGILREKGWSREEVLWNLHKDILVAGYNFENFSWIAPTPQTSKNYLMTATISKSFTRLNFQEPRTAISHIIYLIFDVLANPFQFHLIKTAFFRDPQVIDVKMPHTIHFPKIYKTHNVGAVERERRSSEGKRSRKEESESLVEDEDIDSNIYILPLVESKLPEFLHHVFSKKSRVNK